MCDHVHGCEGKRERSVAGPLCLNLCAAADKTPPPKICPPGPFPLLFTSPDQNTNPTVHLSLSLPLLPPPPLTPPRGLSVCFVLRECAALGALWPAGTAVLSSYYHIFCSHCKMITWTGYEPSPWRYRPSVPTRVQRTPLPQQQAAL